MVRRRLSKYTKEPRSELWDRYKKGESLNSIIRAFEIQSSSIYAQLVPTGGIRPPERKRSKFSLSLSEREEISRCIVAKQSIRSIALQLGRSPSTISREISRNDSCDAYRAIEAEEKAWDRAKPPKQCKLVLNRSLSKIVETKLRSNWSPEQIAGCLKREFPDDENNQVSHETIYRSLFVQARGALKQELQLDLRSKRTIRRAKSSSLKGDGLGRVPNAVPISERPASVEDRAVPGHWE